METKVWFITGISGGLGNALAQVVMEQGDFVIGTFRQPGQAEAFNQQYAGRGLGIILDLTIPSQIAASVQFVRERAGRLDVLVNNAGYGFTGAIEEISIDEARAIMETNFFGPLQLTQAFLPLFREQRQGHIIQISSHGGVKAFAGFGLYNASKFALEGFSEALAQELAPLGINLTLVEPGPFRTNFAGAALRQATRRVADYASTSGAFQERLKQVDGKQEGDPRKAARAIFDLTRLAITPLRLPLGKIALASLTAKIVSIQTDLENQRQVAESVVYI